VVRLRAIMKSHNKVSADVGVLRTPHSLVAMELSRRARTPQSIGVTAIAAARMYPAMLAPSHPRCFGDRAG
jgi:hypothetical protein